MKVLNLDKLNKKQERHIVLNGVEYVVKPMTVGNFIQTTATAERLKDAGLAEQIEATVDMIVRGIPDIDREVLNDLPLDVLNQVVSFVRGEDVSQEQDEEKKAEGEDKPGKQ